MSSFKSLMNDNKVDLVCVAAKLQQLLCSIFDHFNSGNNNNSNIWKVVPI